VGSSVDRRGFLLAGASAAAGLAADHTGADARTVQGETPFVPREGDPPHPLRGANYLFFTPKETAFVEAASERLIPADEHGPGAKDCSVTFFIDHQLAGDYGRAARWYMAGPWQKGEATQGYQSRFAPADMYRAAIKAIDAALVAEEGKAFADLSTDQQDATLTKLEKGEMKLQGVDGAEFFKILWMNTKEGMFSDPIYGGNKNMAGWKMLGFPGARYNYRDWVSRHGERCDLPPVGLTGRPDWSTKG
jgi:gluconate 2-dehydrogenase gamma chain